jgi:hypothetical protein
MLYAQPIERCSKSDGLDTTAALLKTGEELGELNAAHINKLNLANKSASSSPNTLEEAVDVVLCALDYAFKDGATIEQINQMIEKKVLKWELKIAKAKEARDAQTIAVLSQKLFQ